MVGEVLLGEFRNGVKLFPVFRNMHFLIQIHADTRRKFRKAQAAILIDVKADFLGKVAENGSDDERVF